MSQDLSLDTPINLLRAFKHICGHSQTVLLEYLRSYQRAPDDTIRSIKIVSHFLCYELASHIRFAEGASIDRTPGSFVRALEKLVDSMDLLPDSTLIVRPQWHYNFKIFELRRHYEHTLDKYLEPKTVQEILSKFKKNIYIISFPGFQRENIIIHTILGHELGHPIAYEYLQFIEDKTYQYDVEKRVADAFKKEDIFKRALKPLSRDEKDKYKAKIIQTIVLLRDGFVSEILSDLVSVYVFSLGALFSLASWCRDERDIDTPDLNLNHPHPAWRTRLRLIVKELNTEDLSILNQDFSQYHIEKSFSQEIASCIRKKLSEVEELVSIKSDEDFLESHPITQIAYHFTKQALPDIRSFLKQRLVRYKLKSHYTDILKCAQRLQHSIPPNAINEYYIYEPKIANLQTILIGGSLYKETFLSSMPLGQEKKYIERFDQLNQLLMKALELSLIHSEFHKDRWAEDRKYKRRRILFKRFS